MSRWDYLVTGEGGAGGGEEVYSVLPEKLDWARVLSNIEILKTMCKWYPFVTLDEIVVNLNTLYSNNAFTTMLEYLNSLSTKMGVCISNEKMFIFLHNLGEQVKSEEYHRMLEREIQMTFMARLLQYVYKGDPYMNEFRCILCETPVFGNYGQFRVHQQGCEETINFIKDLTLILLPPLEGMFELSKDVKFKFLNDLVNYNTVPTDEALLLLGYLSILHLFNIKYADLASEFVHYLFGELWVLCCRMLEQLQKRTIILNCIIMSAKLRFPDAKILLKNRLNKLGIRNCTY